MGVENYIPDFRDGNGRPVFPKMAGNGNSRSTLMESYGNKSEYCGQPRGKKQQGSQKERKKPTKTKGEKVKVMASFGIFLHLAILCFFTVRYAEEFFKGYFRL